MEHKTLRPFRPRKWSNTFARPGFFGYNFLAPVLALLLLFVAPLATLAAPSQADPVTPTITAQAGIAVDPATGLITFGKNIHKRAPMASTTKIMTALAALSTPGTNLNERYTVQKEDLIGEASMGLRDGENVSFSDLLYGMLLNSGNDAAEAVARYAGSKLPGNGDPVQRFIARMNSQAAAYGLRNTHYANPHGLDQADHYSSPFDLAITGWYALQNPTIAGIVRQQQATVAGHNLVNINTFLKRYSGANGIKPGYTDGAGLCLVASATRNGVTALVVVMDTDQAGFTNDTAALLNYTFTIIGQQPLSQRSATPPAGGGPLNSTAQYIGYPKGDLLLPATGAKSGEGLAAIPAANAANPYLNAPAAGFNAQINTPPPSTTTTPGANSDSDSSSTSSSQQKQGGGPNFFVILVILLIIGLVLFGVARAGYIGGDTGRNVALRVEDMAVTGFRAARSGLGKLLVQLKPGDHEAPEAPAPPARRSTDRAESSQPASRDYRDRINPRSYQSGDSSPSMGNTQNPARPRSGSRNQPVQPNPLDNFFDDVQPFEVEDKPAASVRPDISTTLKPPQPIPPAPASSHVTNRTQPPLPSRPAPSDTRGNESVPKPDLNSPVDRLRPPQPLSPRPATPSTPSSRNEKPETPGDRNYFGGTSFNPAPKETTDSTVARARQAIDYAYAGRLQASTDEFRKVVEQDPMFDFGSLEEFEQMPVLGFKALANAYSAAGRQKFALLLLDMAIEKYPNDLELRNLMRTFKREMGQR